MSKNCYLMEVTIGTVSFNIHKLTFSSMDDARAQLDAIEKKIGERYGSNDPENNRHRIVSADGDLIVNMRDVSSVRIVDLAAFESGTARLRGLSDPDDEERA